MNGGSRELVLGFLEEAKEGGVREGEEFATSKGGGEEAGVGSAGIESANTGEKLSEFSLRKRLGMDDSLGFSTEEDHIVGDSA